MYALLKAEIATGSFLLKNSFEITWKKVYGSFPVHFKWSKPLTNVYLSQMVIYNNKKQDATEKHNVK